MQPSIPQLQHRARFQVGDRVTMNTNNAKWLITACYWSPRQACIVYELVYERNHIFYYHRAESELRKRLG